MMTLKSLSTFPKCMWGMVDGEWLVSNHSSLLSKSLSSCDRGWRRWTHVWLDLIRGGLLPPVGGTESSALADKVSLCMTAIIMSISTEVLILMWCQRLSRQSSRLALSLRNNSPHPLLPKFPWQIHQWAMWDPGWPILPCLSYPQHAGPQPLQISGQYHGDQIPQGSSAHLISVACWWQTFGKILAESCSPNQWIALHCSWKLACVSHRYSLAANPLCLCWNDRCLPWQAHRSNHHSPGTCSSVPPGNALAQGYHLDVFDNLCWP